MNIVTKDARSHLLQHRHPCTDGPRSLDDLANVTVDELLNPWQ